MLKNEGNKSSHVVFCKKTGKLFSIRRHYNVVERHRSVTHATVGQRFGFCGKDKGKELNTNCYFFVKNKTELVCFFAVN